MKIYSKLLLGWIFVTLILTWTPGDALPKLGFLDVSFIEFLAHFGIFLVFSYLLTGSISQYEKFCLSKGKIFLVVIIVSLIFSFLTEGGQILIPGRYFHGLDIIINFLGSMCGVSLFFLKFNYFSK